MTWAVNSFNDYQCAEYVVSQLIFRMHCDKTFWYNGMVPLFTAEELNEVTNTKLNSVLDILTRAYKGTLEDMAKNPNCPQTTALSDADVTFNVVNGGISVCVYGKDVDGMFPKKSMLHAIGRLEKGPITADNAKSLCDALKGLDLSQLTLEACDGKVTAPAPRSFVKALADEQSRGQTRPQVAPAA